MTDGDKKEFAAIMATMGAAYRADVSKETMAAFFQFLRNHSLDAVKYAALQAVEHDDKFPSVKRMREFCNAYRPSVSHLIPKIDNLLPETPGNYEGPTSMSELLDMFEGWGR